MNNPPTEPGGLPAVDPAVLRELWQSDAPGADEVAAATARIGAKVGTGAGLAGAVLKALGALGVGAGLTLAALGGVGGSAENFAGSVEASRGPVTAPATRSQEPALTNRAAGATPAPASSQLLPAVAAPEGAPLLRPPSGRGPRVAANPAAPAVTADGVPAPGAVAAADPSWGGIAVALEGGDHEEARRQLDIMGRSSDRQTRAKARLGLAQLELSRGNRARAEELAQAVVVDPGASDSLRRRARMVLTRAKAPR